MNRHLSAWVLAALLGGASSAQAAIFEFTYQYSTAGGSHRITGTLSGDRQDGTLVGDPTDDYLLAPKVLSASFDGVAMISNPLTLRTYTDLAFVDSAVDSTNVFFSFDKNNFIVSPCAVATCLRDAYRDPSVDIDLFFIRQGAQPNVQFYSELAPTVAFNDNFTAGAAWTLKEVSPVPEPATYGMLLCGLLALSWVARRRSGVPPLARRGTDW